MQEAFKKNLKGEAWLRLIGLPLPAVKQAWPAIRQPSKIGKVWLRTGAWQQRSSQQRPVGS